MSFPFLLRNMTPFIDFEAVASYACLLRGIPTLQLSYQAVFGRVKPVS